MEAVKWRLPHMPLFIFNDRNMLKTNSKDFQ